MELNVRVTCADNWEESLNPPNDPVAPEPPAINISGCDPQDNQSTMKYWLGRYETIIEEVTTPLNNQNPQLLVKISGHWWPIIYER